LCQREGFLFRDLSFNDLSGIEFVLFAVLGFLELDNRRELNLILIRGVELLFDLTDLGTKSEGL
jgi:hypothetical protein